MTIRFPDIQAVLTDIEGTTTPISFVHDVLFPYSQARLASYIAENADLTDVRTGLFETKATALQESGENLDDAQAVQKLLGWITEDRKHPALKRLQGAIWQAGYASGELFSEIYPDVAPSLRRWRAAGRRLAVYSSGSVAAQIALFRHTPEGDLTPLFAAYFDTGVGGKKETASYQTISKQLFLSPQQIIFLSDVPEELSAAQAAGMRTVQLARPGTTPAWEYVAVSFDQIS